MTRHNDLAQDFFEVLVDAHSRYGMAARELVDGLMKYYRAKSRYPNDYQEVLRKNEYGNQWRNQRRAQFVAQGKCTYCGQGSLVAGTKMCQKCSDYYRAQNAKRKARWEAV